MFEAEATFRHASTGPIDADGQGEPHAGFAFVGHRAVVDVDVELGLARVAELTCVQDVGRAMNPLALEGQLEGASIQGLGLALTEELLIDEGIVRSRSFGSYRIPTIVDAAAVPTVILELSDPETPYGLKGVGELPSLSSTPAILAALRAATGREVTRAPARPEGPRRPPVSIHDRIAELARLNDDPGAGGITREVFTPTYDAAVELTTGWMREAGLTPRVDAFGNLFGRREGGDPGAPAVLTGSHIDTTLNAGRYDGVVGVLGGIEAAARLRDTDLTRSVEVIAFAGEEPRFGSGCIGSRALVGALSRADLDAMVDRDGISIAAAQRGAGLDPDQLHGVAMSFVDVHAFVELHIEQAEVLEAEGLDVGVVTHIAAPHDVVLTVTGKAAHAGATPMALRRDAFAGAAEIAVALERITLASPSGTTVGTVGVVHARPGAINVIAGEVELHVDVRDTDLAARRQVVAAFLAEAEQVAQRRGLTIAVTPIVEDTPAACAPAVVEAGVAACEQLGVSHRRMTSGAYHDAMILAPHVPVAMLFVPSRDGLSHHPDEFTAPGQIDRGVDVLTETLRTLAS